VVILKTHRQAIDRKDQKCWAAGLNLNRWDKVACQCLKKCLIGNLGGFAKPFYIPSSTDKNEDLFDSASPQAPPLTANLHLKIFGNFP
jgi:hypothetical protein